MRAWALDAAFWKYFLVQIAIVVVALAAARGAQVGLQVALKNAGVGAPVIRAAGLGAFAVVQLFLLVATLRLLPWLVAIVVRDPATGLRKAWRGMRGNTIPLILSLLAILVPTYAAHFGLTVWAQSAPPALKPSIILADGPLSALQLALAIALIVVAYLRVVRAKA